MPLTFPRSCFSVNAQKLETHPCCCDRPAFGSYVINALDFLQNDGVVS